MKYLIYTATIYINFFFSPILALMGRKHEIDSGDSTWALTVGFAFLVSMFISMKSLLLKGTIRFGKNLLLFPILFFLLAFCIEFSFFSSAPIQGTQSYPITKWFILSVLYVWPAVFIAIDVATENSLDQMYKWLDVLALLITLGMVPSLMTMEIGVRMNMAGDGYQTVSYMGAFAVGILLYGILSPYQNLRFKIFQLKSYKILSIVFILINVAAVFISGGRGGALLLILNALICMFAFNGSKKAVIKNVLLSTIALTVFVFIYGRFLNAYGLGDFFEIGIERTFSYISGGSIDMSETSERDIVYKLAIENINNHPIMGQGIFRTMSMYGGYPHNFFLEILVDGGMVYLLFWIFYLWRFIMGLLKTTKRDPSKKYIYILAALPFLSLQFSG